MQKIKTIDEKYYRILGEEMRTIRVNRGLTLKQLSKLTGISRSQLDYYELGLSKISKTNWTRICEALNVSENLKVEVTIGYTK